jgi:PAS domain S-box-containing protein
MEHSRGSEYELEHIAEILNDCSIDRIMAIDMERIVIAWNHASELVSGLSKKEVIGTPIEQVFPWIGEDKLLNDALASAYLGHKTFLPADKKLSHRKFYENHFIPLRDENGSMIGVMNIMHDVAHRIKAEKELEKLNRQLETKYIQVEKATGDLSNFTNITTHEIKEPLNHVYTGIEFLIKHEANELSDASKASLRRMQGSLNRMNLLLDDILRLSRISPVNLQRETVDLNTVWQQVIKSRTARIEEIGMSVNSENLPTISCYRDMIFSLFQNLLDNSIKFQDDEGSAPCVKVQSGIVELPDRPDNDDAEKNFYYRITITDNGIGFSKEDSKKIFGMFVKLQDKKKSHGSGIGLSICEKIMEVHNGFIDAESLSKGASIHCHFPIQAS